MESISAEYFVKTDDFSRSDETGYTADEIRGKILEFYKPCYIVRSAGRLGATHRKPQSDSDQELLVELPSLMPNLIGNAGFLSFYNVKYPYMSGSMVNGVASEELVIELGRAAILASFGAAGLSLGRIERAIRTISSVLGNQSYAFNLIHQPANPDQELRIAELYHKLGVTIVEASAFMKLTAALVYYRCKGLTRDESGGTLIRNRVIAKLSRLEMAEKFFKPAPKELVSELMTGGLISKEEAALSQTVAMADDVTFEADSGGHTDNRSVASFLPPIIELRDRIQGKQTYRTRIGAGGGIGTPLSALGYFMSGADYVLVGSVNQSCVESGTSAQVKKILAQVESVDCIMSPAADMFEIGASVQVIKRATFYPLRARKLSELYKKYQSIDELTDVERDAVERQIFRMNISDVWDEVQKFFLERDPAQLEQAGRNPKKKMALIFRWYLGSSTRWAMTGDETRKADYQIMCGPAMGAFNSWVKGSFMEQPENRRVVDVAENIIKGAAYLYRIKPILLSGITIEPSLAHYAPTPAMA